MATGLIVREPGDPLTSLEKALLARLCAGDWKGSSEAREQLVHARWGGYSVEGCECFLIQIPPERALPLVPKFSGGPFAFLDVSGAELGFGLLELWLEGGVLHSVDYIPLDGSDGDKLPGLEHVSGTPFKG
ncbi:hypothetical protein CQ018_10245 [Arthrobacter sp. MYb227]|uniref:hypothetical protein n=1 Tax=Arthrobacter sp. MYb227 TaxID=1848601 RepID=UPI000CFDD76C|nr:hypothetical protein [Arthrobacter sp. MYb227]PQZ92853.1 hypothetical protein CQ018_10245 [Arthrobacter sp. MYb227]